eukprot:TRINITY_DN17711_c0_g2_i1.p1 TRINITY_DN17711_c0_g2~~TRINITY_DN17711_c0_g2_i1.p1  ORF type:complete len:325 (+),score=50.04 TRINITY_DN17711_c0_g2_i1:53-1027(+)
MVDTETMKRIAEVLLIGGVYIVVSVSLIAFNKFLMSPSRFPHASALTAAHMTVCSLMSLLLYMLCPGLYPTMDKAKENWQTVLKYLAPLGALFALALYCSNKAYVYSTVAFLQFLKEGNVALIFTLACVLGMQQFSWTKVSILSIIVLGCTLCSHGEIHFAWTGFFLQITSQFAECLKNILGEMVMTGSGLKLDVLTFVFFQAPISLVPLLAHMAMNWEAGIVHDFLANWHLLLLNALNAFVLNVLLATVLKRLSAVAFVLIGVMKDTVIVSSSAIVFGDPIAAQQKCGFAVTLVGIGLWSALKLQEQKAETEERDSLVKNAKA